MVNSILASSSVFCFQTRQGNLSRDDLGKPDILSHAWSPPHLTIHYVEYECQHRAAGGGIWDMHGVFPDVQPQRVLIQHRLVLQQIIQGDDAAWRTQVSEFNMGGGVPLCL